jgi:thiamine pyrophosphokinase
MEKTKHIVILAAGDFPSHEIPLRALREADFVVCCDSAYCEVKNEELRIKNYVVIGDGDSLTEETKRELGDRWIHVAEQDYNDLHKAMAWIMAEAGGMKYEVLTSDLKITILGATGKREDHTLGNISYLATFAEEYPGIDLEMLTDYGRFSIITHHSSLITQTFPSFPHQQVSLFTLDPRTTVSSTGLRWPLSNAHLSPWWQGTLNAALSDTFTVTSDGPLLLYQTYDPKPL